MDAACGLRGQQEPGTTVLRAPGLIEEAGALIEQILRRLDAETVDSALTQKLAGEPDSVAAGSGISLV